MVYHDNNQIDRIYVKVKHQKLFLQSTEGIECMRVWWLKGRSPLASLELGEIIDMSLFIFKIQILPLASSGSFHRKRGAMVEVY